jgi:hypothetical protein
LSVTIVVGLFARRGPPYSNELQCGVTPKLYKRKNKLYEKAIIFQVGSSTWLKIFSAFSEKRQDA